MRPDVGVDDDVTAPSPAQPASRTAVTSASRRHRQAARPWVMRAAVSGVVVAPPRVIETEPVR